MKYEPAKNKPQLGRGRENSSDSKLLCVTL